MDKIGFILPMERDSLMSLKLAELCFCLLFVLRKRNDFKHKNNNKKNILRSAECVTELVIDSVHSRTQKGKAKENEQEEEQLDNKIICVLYISFI